MTETERLRLKKPSISDEIEQTLLDIGSNMDVIDQYVADTDAIELKLAGIEDGANKYIHPSTHPALMIIEDSSRRFISDSQISTWNNKQNALGYIPENSAYKGANNGYASLDSGGKIPLSQLPSTLLKYVGVWNALTNIPELLANDSSKIGKVYNVSVAGTQFGINFNLGDWAIYNDQGILEKSDNSDDVTSVNGQQGAVVLTTDNISDFANKRYVTDAEKIILSNTSGSNTGDETTSTIKTKLGSATNTTDGYLTSNDWITFNSKQPAGNYLIAADISGKLNIDQTTPQVLTGKFTFPEIQITTQSATTKPLIVKGAASQSANLTEWQDSTGVSKAYITKDGNFGGNNYYGLALINGGNGNNSQVQTSLTGTIIYRNIADANPALIVNQVNASSTGKILDLQFGGATQASVDKTGLGIFNTLSTYSVANKAYGVAYGKLDLITNTGTTLSRNIADANPALIIDQVNAGSTGYITDFRFGGVSKAKVDKDGVLTCASSIMDSASMTYGIMNKNSQNNAYVNVNSVGTIITRNIADANTALVVNQANASSTGAIQEWKFGGVTKASVNKDGIGTFPKVYTQEVKATANDLLITTDANKTLLLSTPIYDDLNCIMSSAKVTGASLIAMSNGFFAYQFKVNNLVEYDAMEIPHSYKEGSQLDFHVHWVNDVVDATPRYVKWQIEYFYTTGSAVAAPFPTFSTIQTISTETTVPANTPLMSEITTSVGVLLDTNIKMGSRLLVRVKRIAASGTGPSGDNLALIQFGVHMQKDTMGSRFIANK